MATARLGNASMPSNRESVQSELVGLRRLSKAVYLLPSSLQVPVTETCLRCGCRSVLYRNYNQGMSLSLTMQVFTTPRQSKRLWQRLDVSCGIAVDTIVRTQIA